MSEISTENPVNEEAPEQNPPVDPVETPETPGEEGTGDQDGEPSEEPEEEHKPWKTKSKKETPAWAKARFKKLTSQVRGKDQKIEELTKRLDSYESTLPKPKQKTLADFKTEQEYLDHRSKEIAKGLLSEYSKNQEAEKAHFEKQREIQKVSNSHIQNAITDIPDYHEVVMGGDPDLILEGSVLHHLNTSPAGPYVKYRIASDEDLSEAIKHGNPDDQYRLIAQVHDEIYAHLNARATNPPQGSASPKTEINQGGNPNPPTQPVKPRPKAPPKVKNTGGVDIMSLKGDEYVRARNKQSRR